MKYLSKFLDVKSVTSQSPNEINLKPYSLLVFRLFKIQPIIMSRNLRSKYVKNVRLNLRIVRSTLIRLSKLCKSNKSDGI